MVLIARIRTASMVSTEYISRCFVYDEIQNDDLQPIFPQKIAHIFLYCDITTTSIVAHSVGCQRCILDKYRGSVHESFPIIIRTRYIKGR